MTNPPDRLYARRLVIIELLATASGLSVGALAKALDVSESCVIDLIRSPLFETTVVGHRTRVRLSDTGSEFAKLWAETRVTRLA